VFGCACLIACSTSAVRIVEHVVPDASKCQPSSSNAAEIAKSQSACHQGITGDGLQVLLSTIKRAPSLSSDTTQQALTSIYLYPAGASGSSSTPVEFDAFYSRGLGGLTGKTGCVGILEDGYARIEQSKGERVLNFRLNFRLVSPLGWKQDCREPYFASGIVDLE
jgi:hypothetical protein